MGTIERKDPRFDKFVPPGAKIERLADAVADWAEGPVWVSAGKYLLFSDIPKNTIWKWKDGEGLTLFLKPSGYTGKDPFTGREPGSNGLTLDASGRLVMCQHGDRRIARQEKDGKITVLADRYQGKRLNSPNDLCFKSNGDLYFTDPPYGLPEGTSTIRAKRARLSRRLSPVAGRRGDAADQGDDAAQRHRVFAGREDAVRRQ